MTSSSGPEGPFPIDAGTEQALRAFGAQLANFDLLGERTRQQLAAAGALQSQRFAAAVSRNLVSQMPAVSAANRLAEQAALAAAAPALEAVRQHAVSMAGVNRAVARMQAATAARNNTIFEAIDRLREPMAQGLARIDFSKLLDERDEKFLEELLDTEDFRRTVHDVLEDEALQDLADEVDRLDEDEAEALREHVAAAATATAESAPTAGASSGPTAAQIARVIIAVYLAVTLLVVSFDVPGGAEVIKKIVNALTLACIEPVIAAVYVSRWRGGQ